MSDPRVFISHQALQRAKKDKFIRSNVRLFFKEIRMIAANARLTGNAEMVGPFRVSPQGSGSGIRVAWHVERIDGGLAYFIDDLLYHVDQTRYVDKWNERVSHGELTRLNYNDYLTYAESLLV